MIKVLFSFFFTCDKVSLAMGLGGIEAYWNFCFFGVLQILVFFAFDFLPYAYPWSSV
jgi:hypothetical protein